MEITIEMLEQLASELESEEKAQRSRLLRLMTAYARIIAVREPHKFTYRATEYSDENGHYDNSYPPQQEYKAYTGPLTLMVVEPEWVQNATSRGYYYTWRAVTDDEGLAVGRDGGLYSAEVSGTGHFGQYAAYPGHNDVMVSLDWSRVQPSDVSLARLVEAEAKLRDIAFPLIAAREAK